MSSSKEEENTNILDLQIVDELGLLSDQNGELIKQIISDCYFEILEELEIDNCEGDKYRLTIEKLPLKSAVSSHTSPNIYEGFGYIRINSDFIHKLKKSYDISDTFKTDMLLAYTLTLQLIQSIAHECYHRLQYITDPTSFIDYKDPEVVGTNAYLSQQMEVDARNFAEKYLLKIITKYSELKDTPLGKIISEYNKTSASGLRLL